MYMRLAQHGRFGFDATHAPAQHTQAVDHRRVAVGAHQRVGQGDRTADPLRTNNALRQILQIHLVHNAHVGRHDAEVVERLLAPPQEFIALAIALKFRFRRLAAMRRRCQIDRLEPSDR